MAHRMGVGLEDPHLALAMELISVIVLHAWSTVVTSTVTLNPWMIAEEVDQTCVAVATLVAYLDAGR